MNKVTTIHLNGRAYAVEEAGYEALRNYLGEAEAKLAGNPDKAEIMADFEQAIADKCDRCLTPHKNVITEAEIRAIIEKMGPVDGGAADASTTAAATGAATGETSAPSGSPRRLYRIREGAWLFGVCNGLAAYFNLDVALVRVIFILLGLITHALWFIAYIILAVVMPVARTDDEIAAAHGATPMNAHDFIERARTEYEKYAADPSFNKQEFRQRMRALRDEWRERHRAWHDERRAWRRERREARRAERCHGGVAAGIFSAIFSIILVAIACAWIFALWSFMTTGAVAGHAFGAGYPLWMSLVFICTLFYVIAAPFGAIMRALRCRAWGDHHHHCGAHAFWRTFFFVAAAVLLVYTAIHLFPAVNSWWHTATAYLGNVRR